MIKHLLLLIAVFILLVSCTNVIPPTDYFRKAEEPITETWRDAYANFLRDLLNYDMLVDEYSGEPRTLFGLRDVDNNGTPELILLNLMPAAIDTFNKCVIYTYVNGEVTQIGSEWLRYGSIMISDNPDFPGLFTTNGSSAFVDSYLTINNGVFEIIRITDYDYNYGFVINEVSAELKNEWIKMGGYDFYIMQPSESAPLLDAYEINEENIYNIILLLQN